MSSFAEPMEDSLALELVGRAGVEPATLGFEDRPGFVVLQALTLLG